MTDIRAVCKVFLDFVYDNEMIPAEIKKILDKNQSEWDFRLICKLLSFQNEFKSTREDENNIAKFISDNHPFEYKSTKFKQWSNRLNQTRLKDIKRQADNFFHNVSEYKEANTLFVEKIKDLIMLYPGSDKYLDTIDKIKNDTILVDINKTRETTNKAEIDGIINKTVNINIEKDKTNEKYIVAYYFSNYEHYDIYPNLNQTDAISEASEALGISYNSLRQMRDQFDAHYKNIPFEDRESRRSIGRRIGYVGKLASTMQKIKDEYDTKSKEEIISIVKKILKINR